MPFVKIKSVYFQRGKLGTFSFGHNFRNSVIIIPLGNYSHTITEVRPTTSLICLINPPHEFHGRMVSLKNLVGKDSNFPQDRDSPSLPDDTSILPSGSGGKIN